MAVFAKQDVEFYIYFDKPPFIIDTSQQTGLSYEFIAALNEFSEKYHYIVTHVPKQRAIDFAQGNSGVLWTTPYWVGDSEMDKYAWIENLIFDRELYISNDPSLAYEGLESFYGKSVAVVRGYTYFNLEESFKDNSVTRVDVHNEMVIPLMLLNKRVNVGVIGLQTYEYFKRTAPTKSDKLYILDGYNKEFYRSILIDKSLPELKQDIENWMNSEQGRTKWQALKAKWLHIAH